MKTQLSKSVKLALILLFTATAISTVAAVFLISHPISTVMVVKPKVSMGVFDVDGETSLDYIDLGQFQWGMIKFFPEGLFVPPTTYYFVNNTDQVSFYVCFTLSDMPPASDINVYILVRRGDKEQFTMLGPGVIYIFPIESNMINPDPKTQYAEWYLMIELNSAPFGTYTPTLTVNAYDSVSG